MSDRTKKILCSLLYVAAIGSAACVTSENRCVAGLLYVSELKACASETDASTEDASDAAAADAGDAATTNLGATCNGDVDCAGGRASYCLKDPLSPASPGVCSVPRCSVADCGDAYACCDCAGAAAPELQAWPRGVCVPRSDSPTVQSFGCVCP